MDIHPDVTEGPLLDNTDDMVTTHHSLSSDTITPCCHQMEAQPFILPPEPPDFRPLTSSISYTPEEQYSIHMTSLPYNGQCNPGANISITPYGNILTNYCFLDTHQFLLLGIAEGTHLQCIAQGIYHFPPNVEHKFPVLMFHSPQASDTIIFPQHA